MFPVQRIEIIVAPVSDLKFFLRVVFLDVFLYALWLLFKHCKIIIDPETEPINIR